MWQIYLNFHQSMRTLQLKKRVNRDECSFATKQRIYSQFLQYFPSWSIFLFLGKFASLHCNSNWQTFGPLNPSTAHRIFWFTFTFDFNLFYKTFRDNKSVWLWQPQRKDIPKRPEKWITRYTQLKYIVLSKPQYQFRLASLSRSTSVSSIW